MPEAPAPVHGSPRRRSPPRSARSWAWRYRRLLFLVGLLTFTAMSGTAYLVVRSPLPEERVLARTTVLTDAAGTRLASLDAGENRVPVRLHQVPDVVVDAVLAAEDRNFYRHSGLDPLGIARAAIADLRGGGIRQGGSTITQQYVKNAYLGRERTVGRKLREAVLAIKVERRYDKDEILERYLNTVYFGRGAYGIQAAGRAYFGLDVDELGLKEGAFLAGLVRAPEAAGRDGERAAGRRDSVLRAMERARLITGAERADATRQPVAAAKGGYVVDRMAQEPEVVMTDKGTHYFVEQVRRELVERFGEDAAYSGGLRVRTTLDLGLQAEAYDAVYGLLDRPGDPAGALIALDDEGQVKAMVGGRNFAESKVNLAMGRQGGGTGRQAGSTFKPFLLAAAVKQGYSVVDSTFPAPREVILPRADQGRDYRVNNFENADFGPSVNLIEATRNSVNTVYAQAAVALGSAKVVEMAADLGVTSELHPNASLVLGTEDVSVLEMAAAFSTFANRGERVRPRLILEVAAADGAVIERVPPERSRAIPPDVADVVTYCLQQVVARGTGTAASIGRAVAGKTGTTQDFGDAWFIGYTPKLTTAVWMGYPEGSARKMVDVRGREVTGGSFPAVIFRRFMQAATRDPRYAGTFPPKPKISGKVLKPSKSVIIPTTTTAAPATTSTAPATTSTAPATTSTAPATTSTAPATTSTTTQTTTVPDNPPAAPRSPPPHPEETSGRRRRGGPGPAAPDY